MERFGGALDKPEEHAHLGTIDVVSGWSGAFATCLALFKRLRTGQSDYASTSLAANGQLIQTPMMVDKLGSSRSIAHHIIAHQTCNHLQAPPPTVAEARGPEARGDNALYQFYATQDVHVFLAAPFSEPQRERAAHKLATILGFDLDSLGSPPLPQWCGGSEKNTLWSDLISRAFIKLNVLQAIHLATDAGITACALTSMHEVRVANITKNTCFRLGKESQYESTFHFYREENHPIGSSVTMFAFHPLPKACRSMAPARS